MCAAIDVWGTNTVCPSWVRVSPLTHQPHTHTYTPPTHIRTPLQVGAKFTAVELDTMGAEGKAMRAELAKVSRAACAAALLRCLVA